MTTECGTVFVVDDDEAVARSLKRLITSFALPVVCFSTADEFLAEYRGEKGCLVLDVRMPGMSGPELQDYLAEQGLEIPIIFISGHGDVPLACRTLKRGAIDFLEKPFVDEVLLERIEQALSLDATRRQARSQRATREQKLALLTDREREVLNLLVGGDTVKEIAFSLGLSPKTVQVHRAHILEKTGSRSVVDLTRIALLPDIDQAEG